MPPTFAAEEALRLKKAALKEAEVEVDKEKDKKIVEALDTEGFSEFLTHFPDAKDNMDNAEVIASRLEVFKAKETVKTDLKKLLGEHIQMEMNMHLDSNDLMAVDAEIDKKAVENPEEIIKLKEKLELHASWAVEIPALEQQLASLGSKESLSAERDVLMRDRRNLDLVESYSGAIGKTESLIQNISIYARGALMLFDNEDSTRFGEEFTEKYGMDLNAFERRNEAFAEVKKFGEQDRKGRSRTLHRITDEVYAITDRLAHINNVENYRKLAAESFNKLRDNLLSDVVAMPDVLVAIQESANSKLENMISTGTIKVLEEAQQMYKKYQNVKIAEGNSIDALGRTDKEDMQNNINAAIEQKVLDVVNNAVGNVNMGQGAFSRMEKSLESIVSKQKLGSNEGDAARATIVKILEDAAANLGDKTADKAKKLWIARIIIKLNKKK